MPNHHDWERADLHAEDAAKARAELSQVRADAATVVHALDAALQWGEALFAFLPHGQILTPGIGTAKAALDNAMTMLQRPAITTSEDVARLQNALNIACANLAELNDRCAVITDKAEQTAHALVAAIALSDQLLDYLRRDGQPAPVAIIAAHHKLQQTMAKLLGVPNVRTP